MNIKGGYLRAAAGFSALLVTSVGVWASSAPRGFAHVTLGKASITIQYGRPSLGGRQIRQMIEPGQLWRAGADAATTIQSNAALNFGGTWVPAGEHILLVRYIGPGTWSLVVSKAPVFSYTPGARIAEVLTHVDQRRPPVNELTISISDSKGDGKIEIAWGTYRLWCEFNPAR
jgi:hypothetical protein